MVADLLRDVPGLQVTTTGRTGGLTSVFTRGAQRTGTLFLLDGVPVNDPGGEFNLAHLTSGDIDRIEVIRGPESALFGAEAAAGVVQMFTRRGDAENVVPKGFLSYERGNFGTDDWKAGLAGGSGYRLDYSLTAEQFHTTGEFPNDDYRNTTGSANFGLRISPATQLRGVLRVEDSVVGVPGQVGYGLIDYDARETNRDSVLSLRLDDARGSHYRAAGLVRLPPHRATCTPTASRTALTDWPPWCATWRRRSRAPTWSACWIRTSSRRKSPAGTRLVTQDVTLYSFDPYLSATSRKRTGYQGNWGRSRARPWSSATTTSARTATSRAAPSPATTTASSCMASRLSGGRVFLSGGVRLEHSSAFGRKFTPRGALGFLLAGEHGPLSSTFLRFSAGQRNHRAQPRCRTSRGSPTRVGNPNLRPERTD